MTTGVNEPAPAVGAPGLKSIKFSRAAPAGRASFVNIGGAVVVAVENTLVTMVGRPLCCVDERDALSFRAMVARDERLANSAKTDRTTLAKRGTVVSHSVGLAVGCTRRV